jgi:hypothetical protein
VHVQAVFLYCLLQILNMYSTPNNPCISTSDTLKVGQNIRRKDPPAESKPWCTFFVATKVPGKLSSTFYIKNICTFDACLCRQVSEKSDEFPTFIFW